MDLPKKLRLLGRFKRFFPIWAITLQAAVLKRAFDSDLAAAKDWNSRQAILASREFEMSEYDGAIYSLISNKLAKRARKLHLRVEGLEWHDDQWGNRFLDDHSEFKLYHAIQDERRKIWEFRLKVIGVLGAFLASLIGIIGALIGLVSIWKKHP
ncbi:MAG TPA: hypothetical protein VKV95_03570 [Terriglobia bacterium]|nr:hypothetical protein [Terriglobia bacterium]